MLDLDLICRLAAIHKPEIVKLVGDAIKFNAEMDWIDKSKGFATPQDCAIDVYARTALQALGAGLQTSDWSCVAQAVVMLADLAETLRKSEEANAHHP